MNNNTQTFDLSKSRPQVLLLGNGLTREENYDWNEAIKAVSKHGIDYSRYQKEDSNRFKLGIPYSHAALIMAPVDDRERHGKYLEEFKKIKCSDTSMLEKLLQLPFNAILTTNYTYEVESKLNEKWSELKDTTKKKKSISYHNGENRDTYLVERCNFPADNGPLVWHLHGELLRKSSIVLTHDEYARLISSVLSYLKQQGNRYEEEFENFEFKSWVDYLLMADVYCVGFGFDYSEFDLWWMLGRRMREKAKCGDFVFYEPFPDTKPYKQNTLIGANVKVENLNFYDRDKESYITEKEFYKAFYNEVANDICLKMKHRSAAD